MEKRVEPGASDLWVAGVVEQNRHWLHAYLFAATGDYHKAEDLVQETFAIAFQKKKEFDGRHPFGAWLRGIARNLLKEHRRRDSRRVPVVGWECIESMEDPAAVMESLSCDSDLPKRRLAALRTCLGKMRREGRRLLALHYVRGLTLREVAGMTAQSPSNAGVRIFRLRTSLAKCIGKILGREVETVDEG